MTEKKIDAFIDSSGLRAGMLVVCARVGRRALRLVQERTVEHGLHRGVTELFLEWIAWEGDPWPDGWRPGSWNGYWADAVRFNGGRYEIIASGLSPYVSAEEVRRLAVCWTASDERLLGAALKVQVLRERRGVSVMPSFMLELTETEDTAVMAWARGTLTDERLLAEAPRAGRIVVGSAKHRS